MDGMHGDGQLVEPLEVLKFYLDVNEIKIDRRSDNSHTY
jgi:hypothetical protein